jgi:hypothetical protein
MKKQEQQNKEWEEHYYPEMANEPTMTGDFFEPKIRECEEIGRYETCINPHEIYYRGCTDKCKYYAKPKLPLEKCEGCRKRDELINYGIWCGHDKTETEEAVTKYLKHIKT